MSMNDCNSALEVTNVFQCVCECADVESTDVESIDNVDQLLSIQIL